MLEYDLSEKRFLAEIQECQIPTDKSLYFHECRGSVLSDKNDTYHICLEKPFETIFGDHMLKVYYFMYADIGYLIDILRGDPWTEKYFCIRGEHLLIPFIKGLFLFVALCLISSGILLMFSVENPEIHLLIYIIAFLSSIAYSIMFIKIENEVLMKT